MSGTEASPGQPFPLRRYAVGGAVLLVVILAFAGFDRLSSLSAAEPAGEPSDVPATDDISALEAEEATEAPTDLFTDLARVIRFGGDDLMPTVDLANAPGHYVALPGTGDGVWVGRLTYVAQDRDQTVGYELEAGELVPRWAWPPESADRADEGRVTIDTVRFVAGADGTALLASNLTINAAEGFRDPNLPPQEQEGLLVAISRDGEILWEQPTIPSDHHRLDDAGNIVLHDELGGQIAIHAADGTPLGTHPLPLDTPQWAGGPGIWYALGIQGRDETLYAIDVDGLRWSVGPEILGDRDWTIAHVFDTGAVTLIADRAMLTIDENMDDPFLSVVPDTADVPILAAAATPTPTTIVTVTDEDDGDTALIGWDVATGTRSWVYDLGDSYDPVVRQGPDGTSVIVAFGSQLLALDLHGPTEAWLTDVDVEGLGAPLRMFGADHRVQVDYGNAVVIFDWSTPDDDSVSRNDSP